MATSRFTIRSAVYLVLVRDNTVLLSRRFNTGWSDGLYSLVSGHIEGNESLTAAMCREAREEAGIELDQKDLRFVHVMHRRSDDGLEYIDFFFTADRWEGEPHNAEPEKCDDMRWFSLDDLPENILPYVRQILADYQRGEYFTEYGWS